MIRSGIRAEDGFQACSGKGAEICEEKCNCGADFSIVLMLIGAYVFYSGMAFRGNDKYFPMIIGGGMVIVSIWMLIEDMRTQKASIDLDKINFVAIGITIVALCIYILLFRKIGYVSESLDMTNLQDRYNGLREGFRQCGLKIEEQWILNDSWLKLEKVDAAKRLMNHMVRRLKAQEMPEVFLTSSDMIAIGIMDALIQNGYRVPEDISVVGFDDIRLVQYYNPPVTTIRQQCRKMGETCYQMLRDVLQGRARDQHVVLETELICRKSVRLENEK